MLHRIWNALFGRKTKKTSPIILGPGEGLILSGDGPPVIIPRGEHVRHANDAHFVGDQPAPTGMEKVPAQALMDICDAHWKQFSEPYEGTVADQFSPEATKRYNNYVNAVNELSTRDAEILPWVLTTLQHSEYDAREQAAFLAGQLASRNQLGDQLEHTVDLLIQVATRSVEGDCKEAQANDAAVMALGEIGHEKGIAALRHILTSREWAEDDILESAAEALGGIVGKDFSDSDEPVAAARRWLKAHV